jgi:hypothetical protein
MFDVEILRSPFPFLTKVCESFAEHLALPKLWGSDTNPPA